MVHVGVGDENQVEWRNRVRIERDWRPAYWTDRKQIADVEPHPMEERRVGDYPHTQEVDQQGRVTQPSDGNRVLGPGFRMQTARHGRAIAFAVAVRPGIEFDQRKDGAGRQ